MLSRCITIKLHSRARERGNFGNTSKPSDCAFARLRNLTFNYIVKSGRAPSRSRRIDARVLSLDKQCGTVVIGYLSDPLMRALCSQRKASNLRARFRETREFVSASNYIYSDTVARVKCHSQLRYTEMHRFIMQRLNSNDDVCEKFRHVNSLRGSSSLACLPHAGLKSRQYY